MGKKSAAQLRRLQKRAENRGETYEETHPPPSTPETQDDGEGQEQSENKDGDVQKMISAQKLVETLLAIETNEEGQNSKERRSSKRKAEALAAEETGCKAEDLLQWYEAHKDTIQIPNPQRAKKRKANEDGGNGEASSSKAAAAANPYILFVGQIAYSTTREGIFEHFQKAMGSDVITDQSLQIRLMTDPENNNRSRGFAFAQFQDPKLMYECLKLHQTQLDGRRINVYRGAPGGNKNSESKKIKIQQRRSEQEHFVNTTVDKILNDYWDKGHVARDELDDGVLALCKRRSAAVVEAALAQYVQEGHKQKQNPSAYLTKIICRITEEGIDDSLEKSSKHKPKNDRTHAEGRSRGDRSHRKEHHHRKTKTGDDAKNSNAKSHEFSLQQHSVFAKRGIDMSVSDKRHPKHQNSFDNAHDISSIFPSMASRGRGRGRGAYM